MVQFESDAQDIMYKHLMFLREEVIVGYDGHLYFLLRFDCQSQVGMLYFVPKNEQLHVDHVLGQNY